MSRWYHDAEAMAIDEQRNAQENNPHEVMNAAEVAFPAALGLQRFHRTRGLSCKSAASENCCGLLEYLKPPHDSSTSWVLPGCFWVSHPVGLKEADVKTLNLQVIPLQHALHFSAKAAVLHPGSILLYGAPVSDLSCELLHPGVCMRHVLIQQTQTITVEQGREEV